MSPGTAPTTPGSSTRCRGCTPARRTSPASTRRFPARSRAISPRPAPARRSPGRPRSGPLRSATAAPRRWSSWSPIRPTSPGRPRSTSTRAPGAWSTSNPPGPCLAGRPPRIHPGSTPWRPTERSSAWSPRNSAAISHPSRRSPGASRPGRTTCGRAPARDRPPGGVLIPAGCQRADRPRRWSADRSAGFRDSRISSAFSPAEPEPPDPAQAGWTPGLPASTAKDFRVFTGAPGDFTSSTIR